MKRIYFIVFSVVVVFYVSSTFYLCSQSLITAGANCAQTLNLPASILAGMITAILFPIALFVGDIFFPIAVVIAWLLIGKIIFSMYKVITNRKNL